MLVSWVKKVELITCQIDKTPICMTFYIILRLLTHCGRVTHICVGNLTIIDSDNGLSPERRRVIIWTNAAILLIWTLGNKLQWNFNQNSNIFIEENAFENVVCEMLFISSRPQCVKLIGPWSEGVVKFNSLSWTADSEVHIVHISRVIIAYTLE